MTPRPWFCTQQGAREHYAVPRALAARGLLRGLVTDIWSGRTAGILAALGRGGKRLGGRTHPDIPPGLVRDFTARYLALDLAQRLWPADEPTFYAARNARFDRHSADALRAELRHAAGTPPVVFSYCNACRDLFRVARQEGCRTVLGQFDPGPAEADIVGAETLARPEFRTTWRRYPAGYTDRWREELAAADVVVVNSRWSESCLGRSGIAGERVEVVPLVYSPPIQQYPAKSYPQAFTRSRPLELLFLGQVVLRKGLARIVDAARLMKGEPVRFKLVGPTDVTNLAELTAGLPVEVVGAVSRAEVDRHYAAADAFLLPTLSDGFALTQLEAASWRLPLVVSDRCGEVVRDGVDGLLLPEPTGDAIAAAARQLLADPTLVAHLSAGTATVRGGQTLGGLADTLVRLGPGGEP